MDPQMRRNIEKLAAASGVVSAIGGAAYLLAKQHGKEVPPVVPQPDILNTDKLEPHNRLLINRTALSIICMNYPDRKQIMADLNITKHKTDYSLGYLKHYGLITRVIPDKASGVPIHYQPVPELVWTLEDPVKYPYIEQALQERIARREADRLQK